MAVCQVGLRDMEKNKGDSRRLPRVTGEGLKAGREEARRAVWRPGAGACSECRGWHGQCGGSSGQG